MAAGCVAAMLFALAPAAGHWPLVAACVFNMVSVGGWNSLDLISTELYPTAVCVSTCASECWGEGGETGSALGIRF